MDPAHPCIVYVDKYTNPMDPMATPWKIRILNTIIEVWNPDLPLQMGKKISGSIHVDFPYSRCIWDHSETNLTISPLPTAWYRASHPSHEYQRVHRSPVLWTYVALWVSRWDHDDDHKVPQFRWKQRKWVGGKRGIYVHWNHSVLP